MPRRRPLHEAEQEAQETPPKNECEPATRDNCFRDGPEAVADAEGARSR